MDRPAHWVQDTVTQALDRTLSDDEFETLTTLLQDIEFRDVAWAQITINNAFTYANLWLDLAMRTDSDQCHAPYLGLLAFSCWLSGDHQTAIEVAMACLVDHPDYSFAALTLKAVVTGCPPDAWTPITLDKLPALRREQE